MMKNNEKLFNDLNYSFVINYGILYFLDMVMTAIFVSTGNFTELDSTTKAFHQFFGIIPATVLLIFVMVLLIIIYEKLIYWMYYDCKMEKTCMILIIITLALIKLKYSFVFFNNFYEIFAFYL